MAQSLTSVILHATFSTKGRIPHLSDDGVRERVFGYLGRVCVELGCQVIAIGGAEDHAHVLVYFGRDRSISSWIRDLKRSSSIFAGTLVPDFAWQAGYAVFSVSRWDLDQVAGYVRDQAAHHQKVDFQAELRVLMVEHGMEWDERYFWD